MQGSLLVILPLRPGSRQYDLEGIVARRKADPYGARTRWLKIRNPTYSQAEGRRELFLSVGELKEHLTKRRAYEGTDSDRANRDSC